MSIPTQEVSLPSSEINVVPAQVHRLRDLWRLVTENRKASVGLIIVGLFILLAIFGPIVLPRDPHAFTSDVLQPPSATHWFGTTNFGEDVFVQTVVGARFSVFMGLGIGLVTTIVSVLVGLTSGYFLGWVDEILSLVTNVFLVLPTLPLAILLAAFLPNKGPLAIGFVLTITGWSWGARVLRSQTLSLRNRDCIDDHGLVLGSAGAALTDALAAQPGLHRGGPCLW